MMSSTGRRLACVISSLGAGGAERVMTILVNRLAERGWDITLITLAGGDEAPFYSVRPDVDLRPLGVAGATSGPATALLAGVRRHRALRKAIRESRPGAVISFIDRTNVRTLLAARGLGVPVIVSERNHPMLARVPAVWSLARRLTYPMAAQVVVQTQAAREALKGRSGRRAVVVPNPVNVPAHHPDAAGPESPTVVAMGRLRRVKGFDLLLAAFSRVAGEFPEWRCVIWGDGPERARLEEQRHHLSLDERVDFPGITTDHEQALAAGSLFVLSSRTEGFPNVLCEAMACGRAVVSFDCPSGPAEIVRDGIDGRLVPAGDVDALAGALRDLMRDDVTRTRLGARAREVTTRYGTDRVVDMWEDLIRRSMSAPARVVVPSAALGLRGRR